MSIRGSAFAYTFAFYCKHAPSLLSVMLFAAVGRGIQIGGAGRMPGLVYGALEIMVEGARLIALLLIIGNGGVSAGVSTLKIAFDPARKHWAARFNENFARHWKTVLKDAVCFGVTALALNLIIGVIADLPSLHIILSDLGIPNYQDGSLRTLIQLFLKNLTVIPLTLVFEVGVVRYLLDPERFLRQNGGDLRRVPCPKEE